MNSNKNVTPRFTIGQKASLSKTVTLDDIDTLAEVTLDKNPLHLDEEFARKTRFKGRIAHGVLAAGLISAVLGTKLPGPGSIYLSQTLTFLAPVRPGDTITAEVEITDWKVSKNILTLATRCFNQDNTEVLKGEAVLLAEQVTED